MSHAAAQYVTGRDEARRRAICVCAANSNVRPRAVEWMTCGVIDAVKNGVLRVESFGLVRRC